jgi:hypothetical protein
MTRKSKTATINKEAKRIFEQVLYVGTADGATRIGNRTGEIYKFARDEYFMPLPTLVDTRDLKILLNETGKGCFRRSPEKLFILKSEWDKQNKG